MFDASLLTFITHNGMLSNPNAEDIVSTFLHEAENARAMQLANSPLAECLMQKCLIPQREVTTPPHPYEVMFARPSEIVNTYTTWNDDPERFMLDRLTTASTPAAANLKQRLLVVYGFFEKDTMYQENMRFFLSHGLFISDTVDFVIVVNGPTTVEFPKMANLEIVYRNNSCFDFGSWGTVLSTVAPGLYKYFLVLNSSVRCVAFRDALKCDPRFHELRCGL